MEIQFQRPHQQEPANVVQSDAGDDTALGEPEPKPILRLLPDAHKHLVAAKGVEENNQDAGRQQQFGGANHQAAAMKAFRHAAALWAACGRTVRRGI
jgi:hypothetical protein